jgi:hypothetical protein
MLRNFFRNRYGQKGNPANPGSGQGRDFGGSARGEGGGRGRGNKPGSGPGGNCVCPKCGHTLPHVAGKRCLDQTCPECGTKMIRA